MPIVSLNNVLSFSEVAWTFKLLTNTQRPAYGMLVRLAVHFREQHMIKLKDQNILPFNVLEKLSSCDFSACNPSLSCFV
jgi:hypothetical protein